MAVFVWVVVASAILDVRYRWQYATVCNWGRRALCEIVITTCIVWQVKVRGGRVSLEEVEVVACRTAGLPAGAFAVAYDQGTEEPSYTGGDNTNVDGTAAAATSAPDRGRLIGFFVASGTSESFDEPKLRLQLAAKMTSSQLPAVLVPVDGEFPLTTTGKVRQRSRLHPPVSVLSSLRTLLVPTLLVAGVDRIC